MIDIEPPRRRDNEADVTRRNRACRELYNIEETLKIANMRETTDVLDREEVLDRLIAAYYLYFNVKEDDV